MFVNISNHPSVNWDEKQLKAAKELGNEITDIPFPEIDPTIGSNEIESIVDKYIDILLKYGEDLHCVHIMGEMTFSYKLISRLVEMGILCVASTTQRICTTNPDGTVTRTFKFEQFRLYN